jgi:carboxymethylenebutenolidase
MADIIYLSSSDGFTFSAAKAEPAGEVKGGVIILQEIFGLNTHICEVVDRFAAQGWLAIAPALFDRAGENIRLNYDAEGIEKGRAVKEEVDSVAEQDIAATLGLLSEDMRRYVVGFCWGGSLAWRMACRTDGLNGAVSYYGGELPALKELQANCPVLAHFGRQDQSIPMEGVEAFIAAQPEVDSHIYEAGHGFNCDHRGQYDAEAAELAMARTLGFMDSH